MKDNSHFTGACKEITQLAAFNSLPRWVWWDKNDIDPKTGRPTKKPLNPNTPGLASSNDPTTWGTRLEAEARGGGIGIMLGDLGTGFAIGGVDLDTCKDGDHWAPWAKEAATLLDSYTEVSPSGTGAKVLFLYNPAD